MSADVAPFGRAGLLLTFGVCAEPGKENRSLSDTVRDEEHCDLLLPGLDGALLLVDGSNGDRLDAWLSPT